MTTPSSIWGWGGGALLVALTNYNWTIYLVALDAAVVDESNDGFVGCWRRSWNFKNEDQEIEIWTLS